MMADNDYADNDYAVTVRVRNGRLLRAMREAGFTSQSELARAAKVPQPTISAYLAMKARPTLQCGSYRNDVIRIAKALGRDPDDLFTDAQRFGKLKYNEVTIGMSEEQVRQVMAPGPEQDVWAKLEVERLMTALRPREAYVVRERLAGATLREIGEDLGVGPERIRAIEERAIMTMQRKAISFGMVKNARRAAYCK